MKRAGGGADATDEVEGGMADDGSGEKAVEPLAYAGPHVPVRLRWSRLAIASLILAVVGSPWALAMVYSFVCSRFPRLRSIGIEPLLVGVWILSVVLPPIALWRIGVFDPRFRGSLIALIGILFTLVLAASFVAYMLSTICIG